MIARRRSWWRSGRAVWRPCSTSQRWRRPSEKSVILSAAHITFYTSSLPPLSSITLSSITLTSHSPPLSPHILSPPLTPSPLIPHSHLPSPSLYISFYPLTLPSPSSPLPPHTPLHCVQVCPTADPLDSKDFDPIDYINQLFPTEQVGLCQFCRLCSCGYRWRPVSVSGGN